MQWLTVKVGFFFNVPRSSFDKIIWSSVLNSFMYRLIKLKIKTKQEI